MKRNLSSVVLLLFAFTVFFACNPRSGQQDTTSDSSLTWTVNDTALSAGTETPETIHFLCSEVPQDMEDNFVQVTYMDKQEYLGLGGAGFDVLKDYVVRKVLDTSKIDVYFDRAELKQRYFFYIYNNLPVFVNRRERHSGYYVEAAKTGEEEQLISYAIYRFDRSPENIRKAFDFVKNGLRAYVSQETYEKLAIGKTLHSLRDTYQYIHKLDNADAKLDSVYLAVDSVAQNFDYDAPSAYGHSLYSDYGIYEKYLNIEKYQEGNPESYETLWAFSFWVRRHHEKNESEVITILGELVEIFER